MHELIHICRYQWIFTILAGLCLNTIAAPPSASADSVHVAVTQIVVHPSLGAVREGLNDVLLENGYIEGVNMIWTFENAQGDGARAVSIANKFAREAPDVIVAIATPSAQAIVAAADTPVVFSAVTDPIAAGLVSNWENPGKNVIGVSDLTPVSEHLDLIKTIVPEVAILGIIYNPNEVNSVALVGRRCPGRC